MLYAIYVNDQYLGIIEDENLKNTYHVIQDYTKYTNYEMHTKVKKRMIIKNTLDFNGVKL